MYPIQFNGKTATQLMLNGHIVDLAGKRRNSYYIEYKIDTSSESDLLGTTDTLPLYLPFISDGYNGNTFEYDFVEIELNNGTIVTDINEYGNIPVSEVDIVRLYYPENTRSLSFYGPKSGSKVTEVLYLKTDNFTSLEEMFYNCKLLTSVNTSNWNTSNVTNMRRTFYNCQSLISLDLSNFNTSNVKSIQAMFYNCRSLQSLDVSNWNTDNVTSIDNLFTGCLLLTEIDLSSFNTDRITSMYQMFLNCKSLIRLNLSNFNTSKVISTTGMFTYVPVTVDWQYDGTNYQNWTLTEEQTKFSGTFPWNIQG